MRALDTSVIVPAVLAWHEANEMCRREATDAAAPAHAVLEAYAVLTRLPPPHRLKPVDAERLLMDRFPPDRQLHPSPEMVAALVPTLAAADVSGGASYDGLVALTVRMHDLRLVTRDSRAVAVYRRLGVAYDLLAA